jgi:hypothetical protein
MDKEQIDQLIADAGLTEVVSVFDSAIEIDPYGVWDGYSVLAVLLQSYGAAQAKEAREGAAAHMEKRAAEIEDGQDVASLSAWVARIFRDEAKAIRGLE